MDAANQVEETKKVKIIADTRETGPVVRQLNLLGAKIDYRLLEVGDFICSERVAFERKTVSDFLESLTDGRLFSQMENLVKSFERPILLIEGTGIYRKRNIHPNAVAGALASIAVDYRLPILWSESGVESAVVIYRTALREQSGEKGRVPAIRSAKRAPSAKGEMEFVVAGLPGVSTIAAQRILKRFGSLKTVFSAGKDELMEVEKIGEKKASRIWELINAEYPEN